VEATVRSALNDKTDVKSMVNESGGSVGLSKRKVKEAKGHFKTEY
jgi:hypothetical protein